MPFGQPVPSGLPPGHTASGGGAGKWVGAAIVMVVVGLLAYVFLFKPSDGDENASTPSASKSTISEDGPGPPPAAGPCRLASADDYAAAGFKMDFQSTRVGSFDLNGKPSPTCEVTFEKGMNSSVIAYYVIPRQLDRGNLRPNERAVRGVGDAAIVTSESDLDMDDRPRTATSIDVQVGSQMLRIAGVPASLADEKAVIAIATTIAEHL